MSKVAIRFQVERLDDKMVYFDRRAGNKCYVNSVR